MTEHDAFEDVLSRFRPAGPPASMQLPAAALAPSRGRTRSFSKWMMPLGVCTGVVLMGGTAAVWWRQTQAPGPALDAPTPASARYQAPSGGSVRPRPDENLPNFSGQWMPSNGNALPTALPTIEQTVAEITMIRFFRTGPLTFRLDGTETESKQDDTVSKLTAHWVGSKLVLRQVSGVIGREITLSLDTTGNLIFDTKTSRLTRDLTMSERSMTMTYRKVSSN